MLKALLIIRKKSEGAEDQDRFWIQCPAIEVMSKIYPFMEERAKKDFLRGQRKIFINGMG